MKLGKAIGKGHAAGAAWIIQWGTRAAVGLTAALIVLVPSLSYADSLRLRDEDPLSGELVDISEGTLVFKTAYSGLSIVPIGEVESISTEGYFTVVMEDGRETVGRFERQDGQNMLARAGGGDAQPVVLSDIREAKPVEFIPQAVAAEETGELGDSEDFRVATAIGVLRRWADRNYVDPYARLDISRDTPEYSFETRALLELSGQDTFPHYFRLRSDLRFGQDDTLRPEITLGAERNTDRALALRGDVGIGMAYQPWQDWNRRLTLSAGLGGTVEHYDRELLIREGIDGKLSLSDLWDFDDYRRRIYYDQERMKAQEHDLVLYAAMNYDGTLFDRFSFSQNLRLSPSLTDFGDMTAQSESAVKWPVTSSVSLRLDLLVDYDSDPAFRGLNNWETTLGAGVEVGF